MLRILNVQRRGVRRFTPTPVGHCLLPQLRHVAQAFSVHPHARGGHFAFRRYLGYFNSLRAASAISGAVIAFIHPGCWTEPLYRH